MGVTSLFLGCSVICNSEALLVKLFWAPVLLLWLITTVVQLYIIYHSVAFYGREKQKIAASG
jgi:phage shock protein PspC (stress-responsive transcriptional regulator)